MHSTDKNSKSEKRSEKQTLVKDLKALLSSVEGQRLPVATVLARYYQHFGRLLKIGDYGARCLEDLVEGLPSLQVSVFIKLHRNDLCNFALQFSQTSCKRTPLGPHSSFCSREVSACGRFKILCLCVARTMTWCPLRRGVHGLEVSISRGATV